MHRRNLCEGHDHYASIIEIGADPASLAQCFWLELLTRLVVSRQNFIGLRTIDY